MSLKIALTAGFSVFSNHLSRQLAGMNPDKLTALFCGEINGL